MKKLLLKLTVVTFASFITAVSSNTAHAQSGQIVFDFTGTTTFGACNGDGTYASTSGDETINGTGISIGSTINSISFSAEYGKSGGFGSSTINFFLNGNAIGSFTGINSTCNTGTLSVDPSFFNDNGPNTISFTSSGSGTRRVYNATITVDFTPCTPPPAPDAPDQIDYCFNEPADALTATGTGLLWYTDVNDVTGSPDAPVPSTDATGTVAFYVSQTVGCESDRAEIDVTVNPLPHTAVIGFTNVSCFGANDGTITVSAISGTAPYIYSVDNGVTWSAPDDDTHVFTGLAANEAYEIRVEDSNGCESKSVQ
jgi:hypothetical protein